MTAITAHPPRYRTSASRPHPLALTVEGLRDIVGRRHLIRFLVQADLKKKGTDTILGNVWWVFDPLLQMLVYVLLVSIIFARHEPDYPLFVFSAILPWKWFTSTVQDAISAVVSQEKLIKQIAFPKIVLPVAATLAGMVSFLFGMIPLGLLLGLLYRDRITVFLLLIPVIAAVQLVFSIAVALVVSAFNVFVRDVGNLATHLLRLWFYLSPGLYSVAQLDSSSLARSHPLVVQVLSLNPFAILFNAYRSVIYGTETSRPTLPSFVALGGLLAASLVLVAVATWLFKRLEPSFAKVL